MDLAKASGHNNEIIKEILAIYFSILKGEAGAGMTDGAAESGASRKSSPLLKSVFLGIP